MIVGFIGFGKVSKTLVSLIKSDDITFVTSDEGRSHKTLDNLKKYDIKILDNFNDVAAESDILISANSAKSALGVAKKYGESVKGIYLDLNNISPNTTLEINNHVPNLVDGAIIGKIDAENPILYLSGENTGLAFLCESEEGWQYDDYPIEVLKHGDETVLRVRFLDSEPMAWRDVVGKDRSHVVPVTFRFGMIATPVKQLPANPYEERSLHIDCGHKVLSNYEDYLFGKYIHPPALHLRRD